MVSDLKAFAHKGCKIAAEKKSFFIDFFYLFTLFKRLFAAASWNPMSKHFRFSESLEKSNEKKWSQIWKLLLIKGVKSPRKKKLVFLANFALLAVFFGIDTTTWIGREILCLPYAEFFGSFLKELGIETRKKTNITILMYLKPAIGKIS